MIAKMNCLKILKIIFLFLIFVFFAVYIFTGDRYLYAQGNTISYNLLVPLPQPQGGVVTMVTGPAYHILALYNFAVAISGILAFAIIVVAGFIWVTSAGKPDRISKAKEMVFNAILGLLLLIGSWVVLKTIDPDLGILREPAVGDIEVSTTSRLIGTTAAPADACKRIKRCQDYTAFCGDVYGKPPFCILNIMCFGNNCSKEELINACNYNICKSIGNVATDCYWDGKACWQK